MEAIVRRVARVMPIIAVFATIFVAVPTAAAETYTDRGALGCNMGAGAGSGQTDAAGVTYVACGNIVKRWTIDGAPLADISVPAPTSYDVAPSPDGAFLYVTPDFSASHAGDDIEPRRMDRQPDGSYVLDAAFRFANFTYAGRAFAPRTRYLATDANGLVYVSNGGWQIHPTTQPNVIAIYNPDGSLKYQFGDSGSEAGNFDVNMGIATTRDGRSIYVVEHTDARVQRFDYRGSDATWRYVSTLGGAGLDTTCQATRYNTPYDVGVDPWGYAYVLDVNCDRVQKYGPDGTFLGVIGAPLVPGTACGYADGDPRKACAHGIAVNAHGNVFLPQVNRWYARTSPEPGPIPVVTPLPAPDPIAPVLASATLPLSVATPTVSISLAASDNVAVTEVRVANEDGAWQAWRPFAPNLTHELTPGFAGKAVSVQVRDAAGNESNVRIAHTYLGPPPDRTAPRLTLAHALRSATSVLSVSLKARDDVGTTHVRYSVRGHWSRWTKLPRNGRLAIRLPKTLHSGKVYVQVKDAAGNRSTAAVIRLA